MTGVKVHVQELPPGAFKVASLTCGHSMVWRKGAFPGCEVECRQCVVPGGRQSGKQSVDQLPIGSIHRLVAMAGPR